MGGAHLALGIGMIRSATGTFMTCICIILTLYSLIQKGNDDFIPLLGGKSNSAPKGKPMHQGVEDVRSLVLSMIDSTCHVVVFSFVCIFTSWPLLSLVVIH